GLRASIDRRSPASQPRMPARKSSNGIQSPRLLQRHWTDVGLAHCFDSSSNKILSPTIPSGISYVTTLQRTANSLRMRERERQSSPAGATGVTLNGEKRPRSRGAFGSASQRPSSEPPNGYLSFFSRFPSMSTSSFSPMISPAPFPLSLFPSIVS